MVEWVLGIASSSVLVHSSLCRSNKEGHYPDLITFTEKRLLHLNPTRYVGFGTQTTPLSRGSHLYVLCRSVYDRDQNRIK